MMKEETVDMKSGTNVPIIPTISGYMSETNGCIEDAFVMWTNAVEDIVNRLPNVHSTNLCRWAAGGCVMTYCVYGDYEVQHSYRNNGNITTTITNKKSYNKDGGDVDRKSYFTLKKIDGVLENINEMTLMVFERCIRNIDFFEENRSKV